jgi:hypothetical protein
LDTRPIRLLALAAERLDSVRGSLLEATSSIESSTTTVIMTLANFTFLYFSLSTIYSPAQFRPARLNKTA